MKTYFDRRELYAAGEPFGEDATRKVGGRIIYGKGGSGGTSQTVQEIPAELKPLASAYTDKAIGLMGQGFTPFTGQRFADLTGTQQAGINMVQNRAMGGDATMNAGANFLQQQLQSGPQAATVNPYAQQGNPYLDAAVNKAQGNVLANANGAAVRSGSFGNSGIAEQAGKQMADIASQMYGQAWGQQAQLAEAGAGRNDAMYQNWAGNNLNAAGQALGYGNQAYTDASQLLRAGQIQQDQAQQGNDFAFQQYQSAQQLPYQQLAAAAGVFGSQPYGASSTTTQNSSGGK